MNGMIFCINKNNLVFIERGGAMVVLLLKSSKVGALLSIQNVNKLSTL